ncbi:MAG: phosphatase PAP2 family protein [Chitinophagaceae bacterium]|nr:phosphatase PAP2 family protein [Chitinophagaceae bacterium]
MQHCALIHTRQLFIRLTALFIFFLFLIVGTCSKSVSFSAANFFHCQWLDDFFIVFTNLGDGLFALSLVAFFMVVKKKTTAIKIAAAFLLSGLLAQLLKYLFHAPRPRTFFSSGNYRHFIMGITNSGMNSFPSGHATTAFAVAATLAFTTPCRKSCCFFFTTATLVVYSRIYLGQHFIEDTLAGIIIGTLSSLFIEYLYPRQGNLHHTIRNSHVIEPATVH